MSELIGSFSLGVRNRETRSSRHTSSTKFVEGCITSSKSSIISPSLAHSWRHGCSTIKNEILKVSSGTSSTRLGDSPCHITKFSTNSGEAHGYIVSDFARMIF